MAWEAMPADLERALGGADVLVMLADPARTGAADEEIVWAFLNAGAAEVRERVEVKHDPETLANLDATSAQRLTDANSALSARVAWERGARGQAVPDHVESAAARAETWLTDLATGLRRLGRSKGGTPAALGQPVGVVDFDPLASGISVAGFKRGFR
jgi:hypothetical protein